MFACQRGHTILILLEILNLWRDEKWDNTDFSGGSWYLWIILGSTELRKSLCTWLRECYRQVEAEVVSNSRNKLHQTTYKDFFSALYTLWQEVRGLLPHGTSPLQGYGNLPSPSQNPDPLTCKFCGRFRGPLSLMSPQPRNWVCERSEEGLTWKRAILSNFI